MSTAAILFHPSATLRDAVAEAVSLEHDPQALLATDGRRVAWLPRLLPGWFPIRFAINKEAI